MSFTLYGIKNCDTVKKARQWLERHRVEFRFHDFRADGLSHEQVTCWLAELGPDVLINKRGTTYRGLDDAARAQLAADPAPLLVAQPALIKRPVLDLGHERIVGFDADRYQHIFKTHTL